MGMYGEKDVVVDPQQWKPLVAGAAQTRVERFKTAGHFIMLDEPRQFVEKLLEFLNCEVPVP
jgi:pimeloyl-ACP methyl ester carboxylesterase